MSDRVEARAALRTMFHPPAWVRGGITGEDAEFLLELVLDTGPRVICELGVAAGTSSAALLFALDQLAGDGRELLSADISATCYFNPQHDTGAAVADLYPQSRSAWQLASPVGARLARQRFARDGIDLMFIDADHRHPWPLLDVLHLAPWARPGAWIALHDIDLPRLYPQFPAQHGPMWLFEAWPGKKYRAPGSVSNIGAVRLPDDLGALVPMAFGLLARPWETTVSAEGLAPVFAPVEAEAQRHAELFTMHDGGQRRIFPTVASWWKRLRRVRQ